jgi:glycosyltransferase involved in cell wall biosynthesis
MDPIVYADLRCLQDYNYRIRGIGHHVSALIRTRRQSVFSKCKLIGLTDPAGPKLPDEYYPFVDEVTSSLNPVCKSTPAVFIDGTPMTHDTRFSLRFMAHPAFLTAAVVHDFIPLDWPGYLLTLQSRIDYLAKLARLRKFKLFLPVSEYSAWRTSQLLGVPQDRMHVTGSCVRRSLYELRNRLPNLSSPYSTNEPYFVIVIASDPRKNPQVAVRAVRHLNLLHSRRIGLKIVGHYEGDPAYKANLLRLAGHAAGQGFLEFCPAISDEQLVSVLAGAMAMIVPSHIEGFSLPVVEAVVCGCPVVASTCAAHLELIEQPEALFQSDDGSGLCEKLDRLLSNPSLRDSLVASQAHLSAKFHEDSVGSRFWRGIGAALEQNRSLGIISRRSKPRLAFLSPYPPDPCEAARYTAMMIRKGEKLFDSDLYSDAPRPLTFEARFRDAGGVSFAPLLQGRYTGVISVLANETRHSQILKAVERYGGPCILHDVQLANVILSSLGQERFLQLAAERLHRHVSMEEASTWLRDGNPPSLFLDPILQRASPLIVHTATQQMLLKKRYAIEVEVLTCCPTVFFEEHELTVAAKHACRERHGILPSTFLITSFGSADRVNGMESCILATELLQSWNIPAELYFVGPAAPQKSEVNRVAALYGVKDVHAGPEFANSAAYREFLIASDAAVQLRNHGFGQPVPAVSDCIGAGLSCVANRELAESCDAPDYVSTVPDCFSPLQVAEQLAEVWESRAEIASNVDLRAAYLKTHSFEYYVKRLTEILGIA